MQQRSGQLKNQRHPLVALVAVLELRVLHPCSTRPDAALIYRLKLKTRKLKGFPRQSEPGEYRYSNGGYGLLAVIIERASGMPFEVYLQEKLFQHAGMACTGFTVTQETAVGYEMDEQWLSEAESPSLLRRILGIGYRPEFRLARPIPDDWSIRASGGIITTLGDVEKWEGVLEKNDLLSANAKKAIVHTACPVAPIRASASLFMDHRTNTRRQARRLHAW